MTGLPWAAFAANLAVAAGAAFAVMLITFAVARAKGCTGWWTSHGERPSPRWP